MQGRETKRSQHSTTPHTHTTNLLGCSKSLGRDERNVLLKKGWIIVVCSCRGGENNTLRQSTVTSRFHHRLGSCGLDPTHDFVSQQHPSTHWGNGVDTHAARRPLHGKSFCHVHNPCTCCTSVAGVTCVSEQNTTMQVHTRPAIRSVCVPHSRKTFPHVSDDVHNRPTMFRHVPCECFSAAGERAVQVRVDNLNGVPPRTFQTIKQQTKWFVSHVRKREKEIMWEGTYRFPALVIDATGWAGVLTTT